MFVFLTFTALDEPPQIAATGRTPEAVLDVAKKKSIVPIYTTLDQVLINDNENHKQLMENRIQTGLIILASDKAYKLSKKLMRINKSNKKQPKDMSRYFCTLIDCSFFEHMDKIEFPLYSFVTQKEGIEIANSLKESKFIITKSVKSYN
tara:strand:+ start:5302 stop:5748 length:447 start_codon:yes stop_codon:yes gene_type:complete